MTCPMNIILFSCESIEFQLSLEEKSLKKSQKSDFCDIFKKSHIWSVQVRILQSDAGSIVLFTIFFFSSVVLEYRRRRRVMIVSALERYNPEYIFSNSRDHCTTSRKVATVARTQSPYKKVRFWAKIPLSLTSGKRPKIMALKLFLHHDFLF